MPGQRPKAGSLNVTPVHNRLLYNMPELSAELPKSPLTRPESVAGFRWT